MASENTTVANYQRMRKVLEDVKIQHNEVSEEFDKANRDIKYTFSHQLNIFDYYIVETLRTAINNSVRIADKLYNVCQELVFYLDSECRPLLFDNIDCDIIYDIANEIENLNDESDICLDYNCSFEGLELGDIADVTYKVSKEAKAIETFWSDLVIEFEGKEYAKEHHIDESDVYFHKDYIATKEIYKNKNTIKDIEFAKKRFTELGDYLDSKDYIEKCDAKILEITNLEAEKKKEKSAQDKIAAELTQNYQYVIKGMICADNEYLMYTDESGKPSYIVQYWSYTTNTKYDHFTEFSRIIGVAMSEDAIIGLKINNDCRVTNTTSSYCNNKDCDSWENIKQVAAGKHHIVGLKYDGTCVTNKIKSSKCDYYGQCDVSDWNDVKYITCAGNITIGLKNDGKLLCAGEISYDKAEYIRSLENIKVVTAYKGGIIAVDTKDNVYSTGTAQIDSISSAKKIIDVVVYKNEAYALLKSGKVVGNGCDKITNVVAMTPGYSLFLLKKDGSIVEKKRNDEPETIESVKIFNNYNCFIQRVDKEQKQKFDKFEKIKKEREELLKKQKAYKEKGLCAYCGGTFKKGLFGIKCTVCKQKKDY